MTFVGEDGWKEAVLKAGRSLEEQEQDGETGSVCGSKESRQHTPAFSADGVNFRFTRSQAESQVGRIVLVSTQAFAEYILLTRAA